jgi:hypothetical protein
MEQGKYVQTAANNGDNRYCMQATFLIQADCWIAARIDIFFKGGL